MSDSQNYTFKGLSLCKDSPCRFLQISLFLFPGDECGHEKRFVLNMKKNCVRVQCVPLEVDGDETKNIGQSESSRYCDLVSRDGCNSGICSREHLAFVAIDIG